MPTIRAKPIIAPISGLKKDKPSDLISDLNLTRAENVYYDRGLIKKRSGYIKKGNNLPLSGAVVGFDIFKLFTGTKYLLALTTELVYKWLPNSDCWDTISEQEVEDDCETTWTNAMGANGAVADDTEDYKVDSTSQKITINAGFETGLAAYRNNALGDKSAYAFVRLWIKSSVATVAGDLQFLIDDSQGCASAKETLDIPALLADTWTVVILKATAPATKMNSIASLGISVATDNGAQVVHIDDIRFVKQFSSTIKSSDLWSYTSMRDEDKTEVDWLFTNGVDAPKTWIGGSGDVEDMSCGGLQKAKYIIEFKTYAVALDTTEGGKRLPQRVRWSDTAQVDSWAAGNYGYQDLSGTDWIKNAVIFKSDFLIILRENSIWVGYATGDSNVFQFDRAISGRAGCSAGHTAISIGDELLYLGFDDVYSFDGIHSESIATPVLREIIDSIDPEQLDRCFAHIIPDRKEYWLFIPTSGSTYPDTAWCYNYELKSWSKYIFNDYITRAGLYQLQASVTMNELVGTFDQQDWRFDDRTLLKSMPTTVLGDKDGYVYEYLQAEHDENDVAIKGIFETKDYNLTNLVVQMRCSRLDISWIGSGLDVYYSTDSGSSWTLIKSIGAREVWDRQQLSFRVSSDLIRFRFINDSSRGWFHFKRAVLYWQPGGRI